MHVVKFHILTCHVVIFWVSVPYEEHLKCSPPTLLPLPSHFGLVIIEHFGDHFKSHLHFPVLCTSYHIIVIHLEDS